jgi:two-component system response regulator FlrC
MAFAMQKMNSQPSIHVLVVEDDNNLREALVDTLQLADYQVTAVNSAEEALKELAMKNDMVLTMHAGGAATTMIAVILIIEIENS